MKNKRKKYVQHIIAFVLAIAMLLPMATPVSAQAAENGLYLAYQNTETGESVVKLKKASAKAVYKVTELNMSKGNSVDLCFINASWLWHNAKWTSDNKKVATVNSDGVITAVGEGIAKITLTYDIKLSKNKESASVTVYVGKDNWKLHIGTTAKDIPESRELKVGRQQDLAFFGVADWNSGKLFNMEWMSSDENVVSVDKSTGVITALKPGTAKIGIHLFNKVSSIAINDIIEVKVLPKAFSDSMWKNENYLTYGENYFRLFSGNYMFRIPGSVLDKHVLNEYGRIAETPSGGAITESYYNAVTKLSGLDRFLMGTFELLQNGTTITVNAIVGGGDTYEEAKRYACILRFVEELHKNENSISSIVSDAAGTTDMLNSLYAGAVDLSKAEMMEILGDSKYLTESEIKEIVEELYENYDLIGNLVSEGVTITEYIASAMKLHEVDEAVLYSLSQCTGYDYALGNALDVLYAERRKNEVSAVAGKYLSKKAADVINGIISEGTGGASDIIIKAAGKVEEVLHLDMDSYYAAAEFGSYQTGLRFYCKNLLEEINANYTSYSEEELKEKIEAYEFAYEAYITATRMMLEEALKIARSSEKGKVQASLNALNAFDYNSAVDLAMKYFKMDNPNADEHDFVKKDDSSDETTDIEVSKDLTRTEIFNLQQNLTFLGFSTKGVDGSFGNNTKNAVIALQKALHMKQTGRVTAELDALIVDTVYDIQLYLKQKGYYTIAVDGIGGNGTTSAMKAYQKAYGYEQTGMAELSILKAMLQDSMVKQHLGALEEYVARMEGSFVEKKLDDAYWKAYGEYAQQKMDELLDKLGVKEGGKTVYFTANGKSCTSKWVSGHGTYGCNCCLSQILKPNPDGWFEKTFGKVNPDNLPDHTSFSKTLRSSGGQSCFGWCNFSLWYIFQTPDSPDVRAELAVEPGVFTKEYLQKNVKPGDVLRLNYTHSVLVYAVREDGIEIIDSNSTFGGQTNCAINKWVMSYDNKNFKNKPVCINRVKYFDDSLLDSTEVYTTTDTSILVLKNGDKNMSVQYFQQNLYYLGYTVGDFDGDYGKNTSTAVKNLQKDLQMEQTGEVNMYLYRLVNNSMKEIQQYLTEKGYYSMEIDGIAGAGTSKAIAKLQTEWGMSATGRITVELMQRIVEQKGASVVQNLAEYVNLSK